MSVYRHDEWNGMLERMEREADAKRKMEDILRKQLSRPRLKPSQSNFSKVFGEQSHDR